MLARMNMMPGNLSRLTGPELKQYAFCQSGFDQLYAERGEIGGCYFAYCHVLGELTLRLQRIPTMAFLSPHKRDQFRQQLREIGRQSMQTVQTDEGVSRDQCRRVVDLAVEDFSEKGSARDMQFSERAFPARPSSIDVCHVRQNHQHEYSRFVTNVRKRVFEGLNENRFRR